MCGKKAFHGALLKLLEEERSNNSQSFNNAARKAFFTAHPRPWHTSWRQFHSSILLWLEK
jgi:hypothetical protein